MKNLAAITITLASIVALTGCNKSSASGGDAAPAGRDLRAEAMKAPPLSEADKTELVGTLMHDENLKPDSSSYFLAPGSAEAQKASAKLNAKGASFLNRIQTGCKVDGGKEVKKNDSVVELEKSVSGDGCPIKFSSRDVTTTTNSKLDEKTQAFSFDEVVESISNDEVIDPAVKADLLFVSTKTISHSTMAGRDVKTANGAVTEGSVSTKLDTSTVMMKANGEQVVVTWKLDYSAAPNKTTNDMVMTCDFPNGKKLVFGVFSRDKTTEYFLNGQPINEDELKKFGVNLDASK